MDDLQRLLFWQYLPAASESIRRQLQTQNKALPDPRSIAENPQSELEEKLRMPAKAFLRQLDREPDQALLRAIDWLTKNQAFVIEPADEDYPPLLAEIPDPPSLLYGFGHSSLLSMPQMAIVGSRHCTRAGLEDAGRFAKALAASGFVTTSGMALGIDTRVHQATLDSQHQTIAVIGSGLDRIYPTANRSLAKKIASQGVLLSEHPPGVPPLAHNFPRRNRIISGLSLGVLVVEASQRSGSLITARLAMEQGRAVFAVPGSIHEPRKQGCHRLIRQGAALVSELEDFAEDLQALLGYQATLLASLPAEDEAPADLSTAAAELLKRLEYDPFDLDELLSLTGLDLAAAQAALTELELADLATRSGSGFVRCRRSA